MLRDDYLHQCCNAVAYKIIVSFQKQRNKLYIYFITRNLPGTHLQNFCRSSCKQKMKRWILKTWLVAPSKRMCVLSWSALLVHSWLLVNAKRDARISSGKPLLHVNSLKYHSPREAFHLMACNSCPNPMHHHGQTCLSKNVHKK